LTYLWTMLRACPERSEGVTMKLPGKVATRSLRENMNHTQLLVVLHMALYNVRMGFEFGSVVRELWIMERRRRWRT